MKKTIAVAMSILMLSCFTAGTVLAKAGNGSAKQSRSQEQAREKSGDQTGDQLRDRDKLQDGSCLDAAVPFKNPLGQLIAGNTTGDQDGTGPDRDRDQKKDGSCLTVVMDGKVLVAKQSRRGNRTGSQDGTGPKRDRLRDGTCVNA
jgi:hypothetical protein